MKKPNFILITLDYMIVNIRITVITHCNRKTEILFRLFAWGLMALSAQIGYTAP